MVSGCHWKGGDLVLKKFSKYGAKEIWIHDLNLRLLS